METNESYIVNLKNLYDSSFNYSDPRVKDYPLVWNDPSAVIYLVLGYLLMVICGKKIMSYLPEIKVPSWILFVYNFGLVLLSVYMFEEIVVGVKEANYDIMCAKISHSKEETRVINALWLYFISKAIEFLDTFWMIVRKRFNQITFLHVFHHSSMLLIWWVVINWIPAGQAYFGAALNSVIHIFMYSYYAMSVIPSLKDKLWWKKYLTTLQLIQFVVTFFHTLQGIVRKCEFPMWGQILLSIYMIMMLVLFLNYYRNEYVKKTNEIKKRNLIGHNSKKTNKDLNNNDIVKTKNGTHYYSNSVSKKSN